jgi:transglutaminase-like putative cysteine protease
MSRLRITHRTSYVYNERATTSYNEARMTPVTDAQQTNLESSIGILPRQAVAMTYRDYWGTRVTAFDVHVPHGSLEVVASATVEVDRPEPAWNTQDLVGWDRLESLGTVHEFSDFLPQTRLSEPGPDARHTARGLRADDPHQTAQHVLEWLRGAMTYKSGVTAVHFGAEEALANGLGVCQDLAHVGIGMMRTLGIPARYVSGYVHPKPAAGIGTDVAGQSHAWLEWWDGVWHAWDPTNHKAPGDLHVLVGRGRDYRDVTPLKGIVSGGDGSSLAVEVVMTRLA